MTDAQATCTRCGAVVSVYACDGGICLDCSACETCGKQALAIFDEDDLCRCGGDE